MLSTAQQTMLRDLSLGDEASLTRLAESEGSLDGRTVALVRLAALIVRDAALPGYQRAVQAALDSGVTVDQIISLLLVLAKPAGSTAMVAAAPKVAMALDYDVDASYEDLGV